ncbi:type IV secretory system conjugative DNA transfer family protein [Amycolatopsis sp. NPDC059657]|uniref:type IV secretory system conjugative DNA transfer family protein n=1 Tax=Amycolatopsis sp. NPDC059657 TaxID=3346899 RepID=UPI00366BBC7B
MNLALAIFVGGVVILGVIVGARLLNSLRWRSSLTAYRLQLPAGLTADDVTRWLGMLAAHTHAPQWSLLPLPPIVVEVEADADGISHYVLVPRDQASHLLGSLRAGLPGARIEEAPKYLDKPFSGLAAGEFTATSRTRPLAVERNEATSGAFLASLQPLNRGERLRWQVTLTGAGTPAPVHSASPRPEDRWWSSYLLEGEPPADADAVRAARTKQKDQLLQVTMRLGASAPTRKRARFLLGRTWGTIHGANAPGVRLVRRFLSTADVAARLSHRTLPVTAWPLLLSTTELAGLIGFRLTDVALPGLSLGAARQLPPPAQMAGKGAVVLGMSNYPGMADRPITLAPEDRLRHMSILAPTGAGKSWLLARMISSDIAAGHGVFVIDPKGDLIPDVLARVADKDAERVVVLDASRREQPIGLNVIGQAHDEASRELLVDNVLSVFSSIWSGFWGPRSDSLLRMALTLLVNSRGFDGSALTLTELVPLLTQPAFRRYLVNQPTVPATVRAYWQRYDQLSDGERQQSIMPLLHKAEAFTSRTAIRLMLGQAEGLDLSAIFRERKAVLISLSEGTLGRETASLLGSLLVSLLWQTTLARIAVPADKRGHTFAYIDEAPNLMRLPLPLPEMFSQARGLGLGITTAAQYLHQLPEAIKAALFGTVRSQLSFAVEQDDAVFLAKRFNPLTVDDLKGLARFEVAIRLCVGGVTQAPATMTTLPLDRAVRDAEELASDSRERYGVTRSDVEAAIAARNTPPTSHGSDAVPFGRRKKGGKP